MRSSEYFPDRWVILRIESPEETLHKVFATWYGGYLYGDSWQTNSGIVGVEWDSVGETYLVSGYSGSCYVLPKLSYGTSAYTQGVLQSFLDKAPQVSVLNEQESIEYLEGMINASLS